MSIPETIRNKMVTWNGLQDYHEMLKVELPNGGAQTGPGSIANKILNWGNSNTCTATAAAILLGDKNSCQTGLTSTVSLKGFICGDENIIDQQEIAADGNSLKVYPQHVIICGQNNKIDGNISNIGMFGSHLNIQNYSQDESAACLVIGQYNENPGNDCLFCLGNGSDEANRNNLLTISKDGHLAFNGTFTTSIKASDGTTMVDMSKKLLKHSLFTSTSATWFTTENNLEINKSTPTDATYTVPENIYFYAGKDSSGTQKYAKLICGDLEVKGNQVITGVTECASTLVLKKGLQDAVGNITIAEDGAIMPKFKAVGNNKGAAYFILPTETDNDVLYINNANPWTASGKVPTTIVFHAGSDRSYAEIRCGVITSPAIKIDAIRTQALELSNIYFYKGNSEDKANIICGNITCGNITCGTMSGSALTPASVEDGAAYFLPQSITSGIYLVGPSLMYIDKAVFNSTGDTVSNGKYKVSRVNVENNPPVSGEYTYLKIYSIDGKDSISSITKLFSIS